MRSTNSGLSKPPICSDNGRALRSIVAGLAFPLRQSLDVGVASFVTAVCRPSPDVADAPLRL